MRRVALWAGFAVALAFLILTVTNASWLAPNPPGAPKQIAHRGVGLEVRGSWDDGCIANRIAEPTSRHLPNTTGSILRADRMGGWLIEVDAQLAKDGEVMLLSDSDLACLTDGKGKVSDKSVEELQALDAGYRYTADNETTFPFRGTGLTIPTLGEIARALPVQARLMVHMQGDDPALADAVASSLKAARRDPQKTGDGFYGSAPAVARIRELYPDVWAFTPERARRCAAEYKETGWSGLIPASCEGGTMLIALDEQALLWGWPNRLIARMTDAGAKIIMEAPGYAPPGEISGITLPEQLTQIPSSFNGYVWTDDAFNTLPALIPRFDNRNQAEIDASQAALERRRNTQ
ncbi:MAG: glycerophosphodiester phosphodiesterase family protein [Erythrobacter sp.]